MNLLSKKLTAVFLALSTAVIFNACGKTSQEQLPRDPFLEQGSTEAADLKYRLFGSSCETHPREFVAFDDMCESLQLGFNNNNCAEEARRVFFQKTCTGRVWDPVGAETRFNAAIGIKLNCELTEGTPTTEEINLGVNFTVKQATNTEGMRLKHNHVWGSVKQKYTVVSSTDPTKNTLSLQMGLYLENGQVIKVETKDFKGTMAPMTLVGTDKYKSIFTCTPTN